MKIKSLAETTPEDILNAFNKSFSDYFVPFKLTQAQLTSKMIADKIDLELSIGAFENQKLIAFILHGFDTIDDQSVAYNGGTGVIPEKRGAGLTKQMYHYVLPILEKKGIDKIILEVITQNIQAIKSYKTAGFKTTRELACFKGNFKFTKSSKDIQIKELKTYDWKEMEAFWDIKTTWQNSKQVVSKSKSDNDAYGAYIKNQLIGYVICNPKSKRIQQIATHKDYRKKGVASKLITELAKKHGEAFSIINVDKRATHVIRFFNAIGFESYIEQLEMELEINKN